MDRERLIEALSALGLSPSADQLSALADFEEKLYVANSLMNLTRVPREECWLRHFVDSVLMQDLIPPDSKVLDIGSGPGFPAFPLACLRPDIAVTAVDSNSKMTKFLLGCRLPNLHVVIARAEELKTREKFDVVTGRAVAPLPAQLEVSAPQCKVCGIVLPLRTAREEFELNCLGLLGLALERVVERRLCDTDVTRALPVYRKVEPTQKNYPRRWAEIKAKPLI